MEATQFIELNAATVFLLVLIGFIGGMVSGFIGSGGAFVLTPAMMALGAPAMVAVASNICHKFPKALVGAAKRHKYGQVDVKLGLILGLFAEAGMLAGKHLMVGISQAFGKVGTDLYVSAIFIVVLAAVGGFVLRDYRKLRHAPPDEEHVVPPLALWVRSIVIPGTMVHFAAIQGRVSLLFVIPIGFATGLLASAIAVGGFIGVPAMIYILGVPALLASGTELVIAFVMGLGGTVKFAIGGFVDIRLAMIILAGSLFGIQVGAIGTTYVKPYMIKVVMGMIMITVLFSRLFVIPVYMSQLDMIAPMEAGTTALLKSVSFWIMVAALVSGAVVILKALWEGLREDREARAAA